MPKFKNKEVKTIRKCCRWDTMLSCSASITKKPWCLHIRSLSGIRLLRKQFLIVLKLLTIGKNMKIYWQQTKESTAQRKILYFPLLTHFMPLASFYTSWKYHKTRGLLIFSGGIKRWKWLEMRQDWIYRSLTFARKLLWLVHVLKTKKQETSFSTFWPTLYVIIIHVKTWLTQVTIAFQIQW